MSLPLILSIALHFIITQRKWMLAHKLKVIIIISLIYAIAGNYYLYVLQAPKISHGFIGTKKSFIYALLAARFLTTYKFSYFIGKNWQWFDGLFIAGNYLLYLISTITFTPVFISWMGLYTAIKGKFKTKDPILAVAASTVFLHLVMSFLSDLKSHPHYYDGVWVGMLTFFWYGLSKIAHKRWFNKFYTLYLTVLIFFLLKFILTIHFNHGSRSLHYGPTLKNQIEIARELNTFPSSTKVIRNAWHPKIFPHAIGFIQKLLRDSEGVTLLQAPPINAIIEYDQEDKNDGKIILINEIN